MENGLGIILFAGTDKRTGERSYRAARITGLDSYSYHGQQMTALTYTVNPRSVEQKYLRSAYIGMTPDRVFDALRISGGYMQLEQSPPDMRNSPDMNEQTYTIVPPPSFPPSAQGAGLSAQFRL
jgi:hypothetical protein